MERIRVTGLAQAQVSFQWLTTQVRHIFEHLALKLQELIRERKEIAVRDNQLWTLRIPQK